MTTIYLVGFGALEVDDAHATALRQYANVKPAKTLTKCKLPTGTPNRQLVVYLPIPVVHRLRELYVNTTAQDNATNVAAVLASTPSEISDAQPAQTAVPQARGRRSGAKAGQSTALVGA